jgi:hypothetical protein
VAFRSSAATCDARGREDVELAAQRDNDMTIAFAGTQIHTEQKPASCLSSKAGSGPSG